METNGKKRKDKERKGKERKVKKKERKGEKSLTSHLSESLVVLESYHVWL